MDYTEQPSLKRHAEVDEDWLGYQRLSGHLRPLLSEDEPSPEQSPVARPRRPPLLEVAVPGRRRAPFQEVTVCSSGKRLLVSLFARASSALSGACAPSSDLPPSPSSPWSPSSRRGPTARTWARFMALWFCCGLASGVLPGQSLFVEMFATAGVFSSICSESSGQAGWQCKEQFLALSGVMQMGQNLAIMALTPIGLFFDRWGPQKTGCGGAVLCAVGVALLWASVVGSACGLDAYTLYCFPVGCLICDFGSLLNSFAFMGLVWHFPGRQALILSLSNCIYQVSALLPVAMQLLMDALGASFAAIMFAYCVVVAAASWACWALIPSQEEYYRQAKRVLGMPLPRPPKDIKPRLMLKRAWGVLARDPRDHVASGLVTAMGLALPQLFMGIAAPYGEALFGSQEDGARLAELYVSANGAVGLFVAPFVGAVADAFGLGSFISLLACVQAVSLLTCGLASWTAQVVSCTSMVLDSTLFMLFINRYALLYSPPNRFGTVQGVYTLMIALVNVALTMLGFACIELLPSGPDAYRLPFCSFAALGTASMALYDRYYRRHPPPETPALLPEDEAELSRNFGCGTLAEVQDVVGIKSRKELVKKLSSTDPDVFRQLICSIDTEKMLEVMARRPLEEIAGMMEDGIADDGETEDEAEPDEELPQEEEEEEADSCQVAEEAPRWARRRPALPASVVGRILEGRDRGEGSAEASPLLCASVFCGASVAGCPGLAAGAGAPSIVRAAESAGSAPLPPEADEEVDEAERSRIRELSVRFSRLVAEGDKQGLTEYMLRESVDDMWAVTLDMEEWMAPAEQAKLDKDFNRLVPGGEFAGLLRARPELRALAANLMKRELDKKVAQLRRGFAGV